MKPTPKKSKKVSNPTKFDLSSTENDFCIWEPKSSNVISFSEHRLKKASCSSDSEFPDLKLILDYASKYIDW